ncbi:MAG: hypothetical protein V4536_08755 [Pseudomonadota bacterium]
MQIRTAQGDLIDVVALQSGSSAGGGSDANYKTRLIKDPATGVTLAETRTLGTVTERQEWVYDVNGAYLGVDAWVVV